MKYSLPLLSWQNSFALKQGLLFGCMVDKFAISFNPGETVNVDIELKVLGVDRKYQTNMYSSFDTIVQKYLSKKPTDIYEYRQKF
jgi:hypothetical protein